MRFEKRNPALCKKIEKKMFKQLVKTLEKTLADQKVFLKHDISKSVDFEKQNCLFGSHKMDIS